MKIFKILIFSTMVILFAKALTQVFFRLICKNEYFEEFSKLHNKYEK